MVFNPLSSDLAAIWDLVALIISFVAVMAVVQINGMLQKKNVLPTVVTRKLVHILVGPVFLVTWLLYSGQWFSRFFAAVVPLMFVLLFYAIGSERIKNEAFVASMSRSGEASELLKGTLYYAAIILIVTLAWFYIPSEGIGNAIPTALIVIGCLAGGDGFADIIGRRFGKHKYSIAGSEKSVEGSIGMLIGSVLFSFLLMAIFSVEVTVWNLSTILLPIVLFGAVATIVEALSPKNMDNWTITIAVIVMLAIVHAVAPGFWPYPLFGGVSLG
jgi:dolichol kinase